MPIVKGIKRINPLDLNKNVTIGVAFPLDQENMFNGTETAAEQIKANLINLLLTQPGERVNQPHFGIGLKHLLFENSVNTEILEENINDQILRYIPEITLKNVRTGFTEDGHTLFISISYINNLDRETDSVQLNFN